MYAVSWDGRLRQVNLADGKDVAPAEKFIPGGGKPYALNLQNGVIYTATAQGCGGLTNAFYSFDLKTRRASVFIPAGGGLWGRRGASVAPDGKVYLGTGDAEFDPTTRRLGNGIVADDCLRCSDTIFAAGDCVAFDHPLFNRRMRLESWDAAADLGAIAGRNMAGSPQPVDFVPWMWSDQYELGLYIAGVPDAGSETIIRRTEGGPTVLFHLDADGRLRGASGIGHQTSAARDLRIARRLIAQRATPPPTLLADPGQSLKALLVRETAAT